MLQAREHADAVLVVAREKADQRLDEIPPAAAAGVAERILEKERLVEDATLREERAIADSRLRREREEHLRALAQLLPMERHKTDRFLFVERERADDA
ncbi:MAG TPA: hypothetical protein VK824_00380, partial [Planctomycetota bacterium]|nr:hypothetical protein [Planctomycetota bacterium]